MNASQPAKVVATLAAVLALAGSFSALAQTPTTNAVQPTVTAQMGEQGGTFFGRSPDPAKTRHYYIAAEPTLWDYAPQGRDVICGKPLPPDLIAKRENGKVRYVQYTDASFTSRVLPRPDLGIMGPVLRGTVGEYLAVTFLNRDVHPASMHPHGVKYDKDSEGSYYQPRPGLGAAVGPNGKFTYVWHLDEGSGPLPTEPSSKPWLYHSHVNGDEDANLGLIGCILVTDPKRARADGTPNDVDRELATLYMKFDESGLSAEEAEAAEYVNLPRSTPPKSWAQVQQLKHQGARYAINGYIYGNLPGLDINEGERVRWYLFALGSEEDIHTAHWHGLRVVEDGRRRTDSIELLPASMKVADMVADNPGSWLLHCHVAEHMMEGMFARTVVHAKNARGASRAPADAFLGMKEAEQSLHISRAEATMVTSTNGAPRCELTLEGRATVYSAYSVATQPIEIRLGDLATSFVPDQSGTASTANGSWRVKDVSPDGVVYGGVMEFQAKLTGPTVKGELARLGVKPGGTKAVPLQLSIGSAQHTADFRFTWLTARPLN